MQQKIKREKGEKILENEYDEQCDDDDEDKRTMTHTHTFKKIKNKCDEKSKRE